MINALYDVEPQHNNFFIRIPGKHAFLVHCSVCSLRMSQNSLYHLDFHYKRLIDYTTLKNLSIKVFDGAFAK